MFLRAAKHIQSLQVWLEVCPDGGKIPVLGDNSNRQVESNIRMGRDPEIQGSLNLWQLYTFLKQERIAAVICDNWIISTNSHNPLEKRTVFCYHHLYFIKIDLVMNT